MSAKVDRIDRSRRALLASAGAVLLAACGRSPRGDGHRGADTDRYSAPSDLQVREIDFEPTVGGPQKAVVVGPRWGAVGERFPLLIALHGRGESNHGLSVGAWGWVRDYWLDRCILNLRKAPLQRASLLGLADEERLNRINASLELKPFRGLVVACPYTPDILSTDSLDAAEPFADFVQNGLLPRVRELFPVEATKSSTGIDGVSLGGRVALLVGLSRPNLFGAVGTLQAAIRPRDIGALVQRARRATQEAAAPTPLRLLTSDRDPFRPALQALADELRAAGVPASFEVVAGPHDYDFNRGPGAVEMLLWHDRVLRGQAPM
jgi:iron(III)-salmochelin esterase